MGNTNARWPYGKIKRRRVRAAVGQVLVDEHRKILGHHMSENRTEHSDIEAPAITRPNDRLVIQLVGNSQARRQRLPGLGNIHRGVKRPITGNPDFAGVQIGETALSLAIDSFREVKLPAQTVIHGQLGSDAPAVLYVSEHPLLTFLGIGRNRHIPGHIGDIPEQEAGETHASRSSQGWIGGVFGVSSAEMQFAGPIAVAGYAQVPCVTHIYAKLQAVRPHDFRPIVHDLILVFSLEQWAVARVHAQRGAEVRQHHRHRCHSRFR